MSRSRRSRKSGKGLRVLCVILALLVVAAIVIACLEWATPADYKGKPSKWFKGEEQTLPDEGGLVLSPGEENKEQIQITSLMIPLSAYADLGISEQADSAQIITVKVKPESATQKGVKMDLKWKSPSSKWAAGKTWSDYVTLENGESEYQYVLTCLQPFAEQIILTCTSDDNPEIKATRAIDYRQRITIYGMRIGWQTYLPGEECACDLLLDETGGEGGEVTANLSYSDTYTLANNAEVSIIARDSRLHFTETEDYAFYETGKNLVGEDIYFDFRFFDQFFYYRMVAGAPGGVQENYLTVLRYNIDTFAPRAAVGTVFITFTVTVQGEGTSISQDIPLKLRNYTIPVKSVEFEGSEGVIF